MYKQRFINLVKEASLFELENNGCYGEDSMNVFVSEFATGHIYSQNENQPIAFGEAEPFEAVVAEVTAAWELAHVDIPDLIKHSGMNKTVFSEAFLIPYSTLCKWGKGSRDNSLYLAILFAESIGLYSEYKR